MKIIRIRCPEHADQWIERENECTACRAEDPYYAIVCELRDGRLYVTSPFIGSVVLWPIF